MQTQHFDTRQQLEALLSQGEVVQAVALARTSHALSALDAATVEWLVKQARAWHGEGLYKLQREVCELALAIIPEYFEALQLLGHEAQVHGNFSRAETYYVRALRVKPDFAFARLALSQLHMMQSRFTQGKEGYEARFEAITEGSGPDWRGLPIARWQGESITGKKLYLWAEQGLGDIVMFAGFIPYLLAQKPARLALAMFPKLISLFARSFPALDVEPIDDAIHLALAPSVLQALPQIEKLTERMPLPFSLEPLKASYAYAQRHGLFDLSAPMADVLVHTMPTYTPAMHPSYLVAEPVRVAHIRERLGAISGQRCIGISWHTTNMREGHRNIPLEMWLPLLRTPGCHFVSLQHHADNEQIQKFCAHHGCRITVDTTVDPLNDAEGLAALIAAMDTVVTIDNSNAHLAGALGVPTLLLLPKGHNFRWPELEENKTLWYKSVTVLRQAAPFDWHDIIASAAAKLISA